MSRSSSASRPAPPLLPSFYEAPPEDYVIAVHDFHPRPSSTQSNVYLSLRAGDRIRIHNRDPRSGWWDGELVESNGQSIPEEYRRRGWLPSNHVDSEVADEDSLSQSDDSRRLSSPRPSESSFNSTTSESSDRYEDSQIEDDPGLPRLAAQTSVVSSSPASSTYHADIRRYATAADLGLELEIVLEPIHQAVALVTAAVTSRRHAHFQPSTACVISSIRSLLAATECLSRDSPVLRQFSDLAKIRKTILANLAELVALARSASTSHQPGEYAEEEDDEMREMEMEGMLRASRETLSNVREFLKTLARCGIPLPERKDGEFPVVPAAGGERSRHAAMDSTSSMASSMQQSTSYEHLTPPHGDEVSLPKRERKSSIPSRSIADLRLARKRYDLQKGPDSPIPTSSRHSPLPGRNDAHSSQPQPGVPQIKLRKEAARAQQSMDSTSSKSSRGSSAESLRGPLTTNALQADSSGEIDAIAAISVIEDSLLSVIAALIGHVHTHSVGSHPSSHAQLIDLTRETIDKVKELLTVVEAVVRHPPIRSMWPRESAILIQTNANMYDVTGRLVESAKNAASAPWTAHSTDKDDDNKSLLLQAATGTLRTGTECVRLVRICATRRGYANQTIKIQLTASESVGGGGLVDSRNAGDAAISASAFLRPTVVGQRGDHTLSSLARKVTILSSLQHKYTQDSHGFNLEEGIQREQTDVLSPATEDEDLTLQPAAQLISVHPTGGIQCGSTSPLLGDSVPNHVLSPTSSGTDRRPRRSRASSFTSPSATPRLMQHRTPSRSADLNMVGGDFTFIKTPRQGDETFQQQSSRDSTSPGNTMATPKAIHLRQSQGHFQIDQLQHPEIKLDGYNMQNSTKQGPAGNLMIPWPMSLNQQSLAPYRVGSVPLPDKVVEVSEQDASDMGMWLTAQDHSPRDITYNSEGATTGATLEVLVERMTPHDAMVDLDFWETFFLTFRLFTTPALTLEALELRWDVSPPVQMPLVTETIRLWNEHKVMPVRLRIFNFLKTWLEIYWLKEFDDDILDTLRIFVKERLSRSFPVESSRVMELIRAKAAKETSPFPHHRAFAMVRSSDRFKTSGPTSPLYGNTFFNAAVATKLPPTPIMNKQLFNNLRAGNSAIHITDFHALELARQLTLMESNLYCAISPEDLLQTGKKKVASLKAMSTLSNRITGWVADSILNEQDAKRRSSLLKFFIKLSSRCLDLNNFSTLFSVLAGLNSSTIIRLRRTWEGLSNKYRNLIENLRNVIEHTKNHRNYRSRLKAAEGPALPFLGLILTDITFTSDGNPSYRPSALDPNVKLINFDKYVKLARIAAEFKRYQTPFNLAILPDVQAFLERILTEKGSASLDDLHRKSLMLEPRQGTEAVAANLDKPSWLGGRI